MEVDNGAWIRVLRETVGEHPNMEVNWRHRFIGKISPASSRFSIGLQRWTWLSKPVQKSIDGQSMIAWKKLLTSSYLLKSSISVLFPVSLSQVEAVEFEERLQLPAFDPNLIPCHCEVYNDDLATPMNLLHMFTQATSAGIRHSTVCHGTSVTNNMLNHMP